MKLIELSANFANFHTLRFQDGLNIVLADRHKEASATDSRNGLGKTTAIELIDFCLGANKSKSIKKMDGRNWAFSLTLESHAGNEVTISRDVDNPKTVRLEGNPVQAGVVEASSLSDGVAEISVKKWRDWLGDESFNLNSLPGKPPSFRSLIHYLMRYRPQALVDPFQTIANQSARDRQIQNAFFLNLDWQLVEEWDQLKARRKQLETALPTSSSLDSDVAVLESQLARSQLQTENLAEQVKTFSILPQYREIEKRAKDASEDLKILANENLLDRQQLDLYQTQLSEEFVTNSPNVERLFNEAKIALGEAVIRQLRDAEEFQRQVVKNRREFLETEIRKLEKRVQVREAKQFSTARIQAESLRQLEEGGALEHFSALQERLNSAQSESARIEAEIASLREAAIQKSNLRSAESDLIDRTKLDIEERYELRKGIVARFGEIIEELFGEPGKLMVSSGANGPRFDIELPKTGSGGVQSMAVFAYDMALTENLSIRGIGPGFLIHDSAIFADVDERQTAIALEIAAKSAQKFRYQHLLTMNSDNVPNNDLTSPEAFDRWVIHRLNDQDDTGGLLGQRI